jgi:hypothetical protein
VCWSLSLWRSLRGPVGTFLSELRASFVALYGFVYPRGCRSPCLDVLLCFGWTFVVVPCVRASLYSYGLSADRFCILAVGGVVHR